MSVQQLIDFAKKKTQLKTFHIQYLKGVFFFLVGEKWYQYLLLLLLIMVLLIGDISIAICSKGSWYI